VDSTSPDFPGSVGRAINASGQVVGDFRTLHATYHAFRYDTTMHDLGVLNSVPDFSRAFGINGVGQITGVSTAADHGSYMQHPFFFDGTMHDLGFPGAGEGINDSGHIVGMTGTRAFLYDGSVHLLGTGSGNQSNAVSINNHDQIAGTISTVNAIGSAVVEHAFFYDGTLHELGALGGTNSLGRQINDAGHIVGWANTLSDAASHAFVYDGTMHDLAPTDPNSSEALGINNGGQVVGDFSHGAFIWTATTGMLDLNSLIDPAAGWFLVSAGGINDVGQITGLGQIGGHVHAFLATPVPEPSTLLLAVAGFIVIGISKGSEGQNVF